MAGHRDADEGGAGARAILALPLPYRRRPGGGAKVAGSLRASVRIVHTFLRVARIAVTVGDSTLAVAL